VTPSLFFSSPRPAVVDLPHVITAMDGELMARVVHYTGSQPGLWHLAAPFDPNDVYDPCRDAETPFSLWNLPANQAELLAPGRFAAEALFGTSAILVDSAVDEKAVAALTEIRGRRLETGGFRVDGMQDLPALPQLMDVAGWALIPVAPDRRFGLFVTSPAHAPWVDSVRQWCSRQGRTQFHVRMEGGLLKLIETSGAPESRDRAIAAEIDQFLGRMDRYFRLAEEPLLPKIQQRIEGVRQMQKAIEKSKQEKTGARSDSTQGIAEGQPGTAH
jgi:hypothetical protein